MAALGIQNNGAAEIFRNRRNAHLKVSRFMNAEAHFFGAIIKFRGDAIAIYLILFF